MPVRILILVVIVAAAAIFAVPRLTERGKDGGDPAKAEAQVEAPAASDTASAPAIPVAVAVVELGDVEEAVNAWGTVQPSQEAVILSELTGRIASVKVSLGDVVQKGQVLLEIDPGLYQARAEEAESQLESAEITLERTARDLARKETLFERGSVSDSELEVARTTAADSEAKVATARAALEQAKKSLAGARLRAPFTGHVASRPPDLGSTVNVGTPLLTLVDIDRLRVDALVSEQDIPRVSLGGDVALTVAGAPGIVFTGRVRAIGPQTEADTRQFPVEIEVRNPEGHPLKGGMVAKVVMVYRKFEAVPLLPVDALAESAEGPVCFVVRDGVARRRLLETGPRKGQLVGILSGVAAGDSVVVLGVSRLTEGVPVRVEEIL